MNTTASPRPSVALGQATKFIRLLENKGVTPNDIQRAIDDPAVLRKVVEAFGLVVEFAPDLDLSGDFNQEAISRLLGRYGYVLNRQIDESEPSGSTIYDIFSKTVSYDEFKRMMLGLNKLQQHIVNLMFGLTNGVTFSEVEVAQQLAISLHRVRHQRGVARRAMGIWLANLYSERLELIWDEMRKVYVHEPYHTPQLTPESPIEMVFSLDPWGYIALKRAGINQVADLTRLSVEDRREIPDLSEESLDKIESSLAIQLKG